MRRSLLFALAVAACGGSSPRPTSPATAPPPAPTSADTTAPASRPPPTLRLDDTAAPRGYQLDLTLDPSREDFIGQVTIEVELSRATDVLWMHGKHLSVERATVAAGATQDATAEVAGEFLRLAVPRAIGPGRATVTIAYRGQLPDDDMEGLFRQTENGQPYIYSHFEPTGARRAFPSFDEPAFKVPWQLTVRVPRGMVALGNTPIEREADDGDLHVVTFKRTPPMPSYLVALAVGPFDLVDLGTAGRNRVPLRLAVPRGRVADTRYAREVTGQLLEHLEAYLDTPFPYEKLDSVALPTFLGAMENPGLITYAEQLILSPPAAESFGFRRTYATIAAHEMAHHWFGDLVTMTWWDDIWLNESFADFMADRAVDDWQPSWNTPMTRLRSAQSAFAADALMSARKIHNPIRSHEDIVGVFDTISYTKGGALLSMFESWVGRDAFRKVLRDYLAAHAWGNASSADFIAALTAGSRPEVARAFASFLDQGGIPLVSMSLSCAGDRATLALAQERFLPIGSSGAAGQTWSIPMCVEVPSGGATATQCFLFDAARASVPLTAAGCPAWVDGNADGRGYYRVKYEGELGRALVAAAGLSPRARAATLFNLQALVDGGHRPMSALLDALPAAATANDDALLEAALDLTQGIDAYVDDAQVGSYHRFLVRTFGKPARALGWTPRPGESASAAGLRPRLLSVAAVLGQDPALVRDARKLAAQYVAHPDRFDPRLASLALATATRAGDPLAGKLAGKLARTTDRTTRAAFLASMVLARDPAVRTAAVAQLSNADLSVEELVAMVFSSAAVPASRDEVYAYVTEHLEAVMAVMPFMVRPAVVRLAGFYCDRPHRDDVDTIFAPRVSKVPGGEKELAEVREAIDLCVAKRAAFGPEVSAFLARP